MVLATISQTIVFHLIHSYARFYLILSHCYCLFLPSPRTASFFCSTTVPGFCSPSSKCCDLDHWESIFLFTNANWDTEKSYLKHVYHIAAVVIFLVYYFKPNSLAFFYCSLFLNHLFTSAGSFLSCKCLHNPLPCCLISLYKPLASSACWQLQCHDCCMLRITAPGVTPPALHFPCTPGNFGLLLYSWCWKSPLWCEPHLSSCTDHCNASWSVWFASMSLRASLESSSSLLPSSRAVDDLSFSVFLLYSLSYSFMAIPA